MKRITILILCFASCLSMWGCDNSINKYKDDPYYHDIYSTSNQDSNKDSADIDSSNNSNEITIKPHTAKFAVTDDGNGIEISYGYGEDVLTVLLNKRGGNDLFDFCKISTSAETIFHSTSSDWHSPFIVKALDNGDGDTPESAYFTGGNHQTNNFGAGGAATARTSKLELFADSKPLSAGDSGTADIIEMRWTNMIQGYNTTKADGSGREVLQENHILKFINEKFEAYVEIIPLEDVIISTYYGLQGITSSYPKVRYIGGANQGEYEGTSESGDLTTYRIECHRGNHKMNIEIDPEFDLGKRTDTFAHGTKGAFATEYGKCYFTIINKPVAMSANSTYCLRGSWEFAPV